MEIGVIGMGRMGASMVRRLLRARHQCVVYDIHPEVVQALVKEGAVRRLDPIFAARAADIETASRTAGREKMSGTAEHGYLHCGPAGAGHFVKMVHNGIECGVMVAGLDCAGTPRQSGSGRVQRPGFGFRQGPLDGRGSYRRVSPSSDDQCRALRSLQLTRRGRFRRQSTLSDALRVRWPRGKDYNDQGTFMQIKETQGRARRSAHYFAIPPSLFPTVIAGLGAADLADHARVIVEKPFGRGLAWARELNRVALLAMEAPAYQGFGTVRSEKAKVFQAMRPLKPDDLVRGQYAGYRKEPNVAKNPDVETFSALRLFINSWRWEGVPWYLRSGKCLTETAHEVLVELIEHKQYINEHGEDMPEIRYWTWEPPHE